MDLHVVGPAATPEERKAIDAVLDPLIGPARAGWDGGLRDPAIDGRVARGGRQARARRDLLLPALEAAVARTGWLSRGALNHACRRLSVPPADAHGVASFYALLPLTERPPVVAHVCDDLACRLAGAERVCAELEALAGPPGTPIREGAATWVRSACLGQCERPTAALITVAGEAPGSTVVGEITDGGGLLETLDWAVELAASEPAAIRAELEPGGPDPIEWVRGFVPQAGDEGLRLLARVGRVDPTSLDAYLASGGYEGLRRAVELGPDAVIAEVTASGLVGRGGAAFPTGRKRAAVAAHAETQRYVVCNADESEPGTFKDRAILEEDPFALIEAMTITGFAVGAARGYLYLRGEYPLARQRLTGALEQVRAAGLLGEDIAGRGWAFDIELRIGAGAYIAGEETALFESIEGRRPEPRNKPPFPVEVGLFGRPTVINNVETLANIPLILQLGATAFAALGTSGSNGHKLFCVSGQVERPGVYEVPFGATVGELIALAGGVAGGRALQAVLLGGAAGTFVGPDRLDLPLTFEDTREAGAALGSGVVMVYDETADLPDALRRIAAFFRDESCGQCVPCRVGTVRQEELLARLAAGRPLGSVETELALFEDIAQAMRDASICGLGQTASSAIGSALAAGLVRFDDQAFIVSTALPDRIATRGADA
jgi:NADH-quinone oxidoreductase subunit F